MPVPTLTLKNGHAIPVLGQGTWELGEPAGDRAAEIATLLQRPPLTTGDARALLGITPAAEVPAAS